MDKTFAAIEKLKGVELELLRLKNALDMMNKAYESKRGWKGLTDEERLVLWNGLECDLECMKPAQYAEAIESRLREKNSG